jgi:hypothetical protein
MPALRCSIAHISHEDVCSPEKWKAIALRRNGQTGVARYFTMMSFLSLEPHCATRVGQRFKPERTVSRLTSAGPKIDAGYRVAFFSRRSLAIYRDSLLE